MKFFNGVFIGSVALLGAATWYLLIDTSFFPFSKNSCVFDSQVQSIYRINKIGSRLLGDVKAMVVDVGPKGRGQLFAGQSVTLHSPNMLQNIHCP